MEFSGITKDQIDQYWQDGYLMLPGLFNSTEMDLLLETAKADQLIASKAQELNDGEGGQSKLSLWYVPGDDIYGMFARSPRIADTLEALLDGQLYHYHSKMMLKEPYTGGAWAWHQDYGYWYHEGFPMGNKMASCLIAIDRANKENGCLQVLKGSHKLDRVDHILTGDQTGAAPDWIEYAVKRFELVYCEMEPGTALFFHSNILHRSDQNKSPNSRWSLISCYTTGDNLPFKDRQHPGYTPLEKVDDDAIIRTGAKAIDQSTVFLTPDKLSEYNEELHTKGT